MNYKVTYKLDEVFKFAFCNQIKLLIGTADNVYNVMTHLPPFGC